MLLGKWHIWEKAMQTGRLQIIPERYYWKFFQNLFFLHTDALYKYSSVCAGDLYIQLLLWSTDYSNTCWRLTQCKRRSLQQTDLPQQLWSLANKINFLTSTLVILYLKACDRYCLRYKLRKNTKLQSSSVPLMWYGSGNQELLKGKMP